MFLVELENGKTITETETTWKDLSDNVPLSMALICNCGVVVGLAGMDKYWFSNQAVASMGKSGKLVAQIIGGEKDGKITEFIQSTDTGKVGMFNENKFQISMDHKNGRSNHEDSTGRDGIFTRLFRRFK